MVDSTSQGDPAPSQLRTTRFQFQRDDEIIKSFFETNVYKSAAIVDLIYLFVLTHGKDANPSQMLRDMLVDSVGATDNSATDNTVSRERSSSATVHSVDAQQSEQEVYTFESRSEDNAENLAPEKPEKPVPDNRVPDKPDNPAFDINEMF